MSYVTNGLEFRLLFIKQVKNCTERYFCFYAVFFGLFWKLWNRVLFWKKGFKLSLWVEYSKYETPWETVVSSSECRKISVLTRDFYQIWNSPLFYEFLSGFLKISDNKSNNGHFYSGGYNFHIELNAVKLCATLFQKLA